MKFVRSVCALLAIAGCLGFLGISESEAFGRRRAYPYPAIEYAPNVIYPYYYYNPYVAPLPAYGILPPPLATYQMLQGQAYGTPGQGYFPSAEDYGHLRDPGDPAPRKRPSLYPAVPFGPSNDHRLADLRRVRFEIGVPYENAVVYFDGVKTKQTGMTRVFVTPPMEEDKQYTVKIKVEFTDSTGTPRTREREFTVIAGESIRHKFVE